MKTLGTVALFVVAAMLQATTFGADASETLDKSQVPEDKQTVLGLYLTSQQAYAKWQADPENVTIIDVRTPEEYVFVGHAAMAWNVPLKFLAYQWSDQKSQLAMRTNEQFVDQVRKIVDPQDTVLVTCRSGQRSGPAVDLLAKAGFQQAYSIVDGFEGDKVQDPDSVFQGQRMKNGWRNAGLPWTYDLDPQLVYLESKNP
jgi:rhodanese-related sulfurtransferase